MNNLMISFKHGRSLLEKQFLQSINRVGSALLTGVIMFYLLVGI